MFSDDEKEYLRELVKRELDNFRKQQPTVAAESSVKFLKAEHEVRHFLETLVKKLE